MTDDLASLSTILACPHDRSALRHEAGWLHCDSGHRFPVVEGVPVLLRDDVLQTIGIASESLRLARLYASGVRDDLHFVDSLGLSVPERDGVRERIAAGNSGVDAVVAYLVAATNGILYKHLIGSLSEYPIPNLPMSKGNGGRLLDVGCSWGRWSVAGARSGYKAVGLDPSLGAVLAAKRMAEKIGAAYLGVVGDARYLPFRAGTFDAAYSYSVLQHFSVADATKALGEMAIVLRLEAPYAVQMASAWGVRSLQHQMRRGFREAVDFEVRYWTPFALRQSFLEAFGEANISVDCYFGLGLQPSDMDLLSAPKKAIVRASEGLKRVANWLPPLTYCADSLFIKGRKAIEAIGSRGSGPA